MNVFNFVAGGAILVGHILVFSTVAVADDPIKLEAISPEPPRASRPNDKSIQFRAGWPLTFRMTVKNRDIVGVGSFGPPELDEDSVFPEINQGGAIVFDDPDGCYSPPSNVDCGIVDETLIEFYPDSDLRGVSDQIGNLAQWEAATISGLRPAYGGPSLFGELFGDSGGVVDGWGWGADDDIPGLVILADVGGSLVLKDSNSAFELEPGDEGFWDPVEPATMRNSAGFMTMVGYELSTARGKTSITASMLVPRHLYSHTRLIDECTGLVVIDEVTGDITCTGGAIQRIDGGQEMPYDSEDPIDTDVVLRAFVVANLAPPAPATYQAINALGDMDGNGRVNRKDAVLAGYEVLSNQVKIKFTQFLNSTGVCNGLDTPDSGIEFNQRGTDIYADLDGNGYSLITDPVCPGGGGGVGEPPRR